ncbi:hypothetical protein AMJ48_02270 [Parcubacteria bacterium DG_74_1]|nr:MAG: hypothetical protein AMJ48_02270 [Parcubacteria bacterium DG_74_1]
MAEEITKEEIQKLMRVRGNVRGAILQSHAIFIQNREGKGGVGAVEKKITELGYPVNFEKFKAGEWYPESLSTLIILTAKTLFNWTEKDIFEMGRSAPKYNFIAKILMRYFVSLEKFLAEVPNYWRKHLDCGKLEVVQFDEEKKYIVLREKDFKFHPIICVYHAGYYQGITEYVVKAEKISIKETKCVFKGDLYNEYVITWD